MDYPSTRLRRLRGKQAMRDMVQQTRVSVKDLICPLFVKHGKDLMEPIQSLEGCYYFSPDKIADEAKEIYDLGIPAILLFGSSENKDSIGSEAWSHTGAVQQSIKAIKDHCPELIIITDVCLCSYTDSGHCGLVEDKQVLNDESCRLLAKAAVSHAQAGADIVAPSDMMDGRVKHIRQTLDAQEYPETAIMSYSAKYASSFYGPFRDISDSAPSFGNRKSYQMNIANSDEAMREIRLDLDEGADFVMIKPSLSYLDIIYRAKQNFMAPLAAYNVSGEYAMIKQAAKEGLIEEDQAIDEVLTSIKRAGADMIVTYFAKKAAKIYGQ